MSLSSLSKQTGLDAFLIVSNVSLWIPSALSFYYLRLTKVPIYFVLGPLYFIMGLVSGLYHSCDSFPSTCLFEFKTHNNLDFFFAQLIIPVSAIYLIYFPPWLYWFQGVLILVLFAPAVWVITVTMSTDLWVQGLIAGASLLPVLIYWAWYAYYTQKITGKARFPPYSWGYLVLTISLLGLSVTLFSFQQLWHSGYWAIHSLWHILAAIGQYFLLKVRTALPQYNKQINAMMIGTNAAANLTDAPTEAHCYYCLGPAPDAQLRECGHFIAHSGCLHPGYLENKGIRCPHCQTKSRGVNIISK